jgi:hypothetical protein
MGIPPLPPGVAASRGSAEACIVDKIDQFAAELANPSTAPAERLLALKFLLHLVATCTSPFTPRTTTTPAAIGSRWPLTGSPRTATCTICGIPSLSSGSVPILPKRLRA